MKYILIGILGGIPFGIIVGLIATILIHEFRGCHSDPASGGGRISRICGTETSSEILRRFAPQDDRRCETRAFAPIIETYQGNFWMAGNSKSIIVSWQTPPMDQKTSCAQNSDCPTGLVCAGRRPTQPSKEIPGVCVSSKAAQTIQ